MKVNCRIYLVEDEYGKRACATCEDTSDTIHIFGLLNNTGETPYFESEAYHLEDWCIANGFKYKCIEKEFDFDELWSLTA